MNLDHDVFQVGKLSEDQKKKVFTKNWSTLFPKFWSRPKKKGLHRKFPRIQVETCAQMHTRVKSGRDADEDHTQTMGGI